MRIAYLGNYLAQHTTENHIALTLEDLGHQVVRIQEKNEDSDGSIPLLAQGCDLFLWTRTWAGYCTKADLKKIGAMGIPSASMHLDLYVGLQREAGLDTDAFWATDFVFTPDGSEQAARVFRQKNINHYYQKPGVYKAECFMAEKSGENIDVLFVGGGDRPDSPYGYGHKKEWPYRDKLIGWLYDTYGNRFTKFGHPQPTIRNAELNQLYASSKVVVGDSLCLNFNHPYYWSDRAYETLGRGGFLIHPYIKGMEEEFIDGKTIVFYEYNDWAGLKDIIDFYLANPQKREDIRHAGFNFVKDNATYHDRLTQMLDVIGSATAVPTPSVAVSATPMTEAEQAQTFLDANKRVPPVKINLGSGNDPLEGHINVDMLKRDDVDVVHNLMDFPYPFEDNSASHIKAIDVIEHLDHYTEDKRPTIMAFVEECSRILQLGGELYIQTPSWDSELFKIDPTHVRGFHPQSFDFFDDDKWYGQIRDFYGGAKFKVRCEELENKNLRFWLVKQ